jgi:hypothetical protein
MVSQESVAAQLKRIGFSEKAWGRAEVRELPNIILPDEEIFECVNGIYEGGFALLVSTDVRVLLIDKKPFNFLTVEDLRFDMINEIDYNHRAFGAYVDITTGNRELKFRSYNQPRLRKLINHVQGCMADIKKKQANHQAGQNQHLQAINGHLQTYLLAQHKHQEELQRRLEEAQRGGTTVSGPAPAPPLPSPELSDYLLAQGLLTDYEARTGKADPQVARAGPPAVAYDAPSAADGSDDAAALPDDEQREELRAEAQREIFGGHPAVSTPRAADRNRVFEINPLKLAYSKLPMAMRRRKFGRPSLPTPPNLEEAPAEP